VAESCMAVCFARFSTSAIFNIDISQDNVATSVKCDGKFNDQFIANLLLSPFVKEFWKSVNIWRSYWQQYSGLLFTRGL